MSATHALFHYSVTIHTDDRFLLGCLRAISQEAQGDVNVRIPWGGTKAPQWKRAKNHATFRFTSSSRRQTFITESLRLLGTALWRITAQSENDPATPQDSN